MEALVFRDRPADGDPSGLLVLHHGRGTDEVDLLGLAELLDPDRRLHIVAPRAPLTLPGSPGYHWYVVPRVGYPDPVTFHAAFDKLAKFHDQLWEETGIPPERTVLGGFSMGAVMSYSLGLSPRRPAPGGIMALSGFIPNVADWEPSYLDRPHTQVFIAHGAADPVIDVEFAREARKQIDEGCIPLEYHEGDSDHRIDPAHIGAAIAWLARVV